MNDQEKIQELRILLGMIYGAYEEAQDNIRKHAVKIYMKYFPVIQGSKFTISLSQLKEKVENENKSSHYNIDKIREILGLE